MWPHSHFICGTSLQHELITPAGIRDNAIPDLYPVFSIILLISQHMSTSKSANSFLIANHVELKRLALILLISLSISLFIYPNICSCMQYAKRRHQKSCRVFGTGETVTIITWHYIMWHALHNSLSLWRITFVLASHLSELVVKERPLLVPNLSWT